MAIPERDDPTPAPTTTALSAEPVHIDVPAEIRSASGMKKLDWVLSLPSTADFVRALRPQELYRWLRDIGRDDAYPLLEFAEPDQLQALLDIDVWNRHELSIPRMLEWLDLALAVDTETAEKLIRSQDETTYTWLFTGDIQVLPADTDIDAIPDELSFFPTPDGLFVVTVPREHPLEDRMPQLLKLMWSGDMDRARLIFQQAQFELHEGAGEEMERFRSARLQDLGFEPPHEAMSVFEVIEVGALAQALAGEVAEVAPPVASVARNVGFELSLGDAQAPELLANAVSSLAPREHAEFSRGFAYLANKVFMAETGDLSRLDDLPEFARYAAAMANLGLARLAREDAEAAARIVSQVTPELLFKAGWTQVFALAKKARRTCRRAGVELGFALFGAPTDEALHAAQLLRPLYAMALDEPGHLGQRPFATLGDLARVEAHLAHADDLLDAFEVRFGVTVDALQHADSLGLSRDERRRIRLTTLIRTGLANLLLKDAFTFEPLDRAGVAAFARAALERDGGMTPLLARGVAALTTGDGRAEMALGQLVARAIDELVESLGPVEDRDLDLRYVGELFLVTGPERRKGETNVH